jgi:DNA-binding NarL/FixJ family response regulator
MLKPLQEAEIDLVSSDLVSIADLGLGASGVSGRSQMKVDAELTPREREVLSLMASGATNAVIATRLVISENTVKSHVKQILRKLGAGNRAEATSRFLAGSEIAPPALEPRAFRD